MGDSAGRVSMFPACRGLAVVLCSRGMRPWPNALRGHARAGVTAGMVSVLLAVAVLSGAQWFHRCLHADGVDSSWCPVCTLARGEVEAPRAGADLAVVMLVLWTARMPGGATDVAPTRHAVAPKRAPPSRSPLW